MDDWKSFESEHYGKDVCIAVSDGVIDFSPKGMENVRGGSFRSYDEYLDVQQRSCGQSRIRGADRYADRSAGVRDLPVL